MSAIWAFISTVLSGVLIYVVGQIILKLVIEPVHDMKRTIAEISHFLIEYADVIHNPGVPAKEKTTDVSQRLRKLSARLHAHLFLIPGYEKTAFLFRLPSQDKTLAAARQLIGLSNIVSVRRTDIPGRRMDIYEEIAKRCEAICDSLGIYVATDNRWPTDEPLTSQETGA